MLPHLQPGPQIIGAMTAAASPDWAARAQAAHELTPAADHPAVAQALLALLLDAHDTAVTDATCHALLARGDTHAIRLIAQAIATAGDEHLDHLYGALAQDLQPDGPIQRFKNTCRELARDPDPAIREGIEELITWTEQWNAAELPSAATFAAAHPLQPGLFPSRDRGQIPELTNETRPGSGTGWPASARGTCRCGPRWRCRTGS
jgi:hypothetical protein